MDRPSVGSGWRLHYRQTTRSLQISTLPWSSETKLLLHSSVVGVAAGLVACVFYTSLEAVQRVVLEGFAGYTPLAAAGEGLVRETLSVPFKPWLLCVLPAVGALIGGLLSYHFAP